MNTSKNHADSYSEEKFWEKINKVRTKAKEIAKEIIEKAFVLYYCFLDDDTPKWAKGVIIGALGYLISPIDAIPDFLPVIGYSDDIAVLAGAIILVALSIKKEHTEKAKEKVNTYFTD